MPASGQNIQDISVPVLVEDPTIYRESRIDHASRFFMMNRTAPAPSTRSHPLAMLQVPRPPPMLFEDRFVSVYSVLEVGIQTSSPPIHARLLQFVTLPSTRLDDPQQEDQFHRVDHGLLLTAFRGFGTSVVMSFSFDSPDLCDAPWTEYVRPTAPADLFPFRQIRTVPLPPPQPLPAAIFFAMQPVSPRLEAETDFRVIDHAARVQPFRQIYPPPTPATLRVMATQVGFYNNITRNIGDVFDVVYLDFASDMTDYLLAVEGAPFFGWMVVVAPSTPLITNAPTPLTTANKPRTVY